ncbi:MAG: hypothetical protein JWM59_682 [Verrucomicrobiales bacterium]|nr:hypothetical protein [Verrucomicrobiales bacterium]
MTYALVEARFKKDCAASELVGDRLLHYLPEERVQ